jgi:peroxiredoxin
MLGFACLSLVLALAEPPAPPSFRIPDFRLPDHRGVWHDARLSDGKVLVVVFLGVDCPLAQLYAGRLAELADIYQPRGARFLAIDSNAHDTEAEFARFARDHALGFPLLKDGEARVADLFSATRSPEVFVLDGERMVRYRGRIDDEYTSAGYRPAPSRRDLAIAIEELLEGKAVSVSVTQATGCRIQRGAKKQLAGDVTYSRDVRPVLEQHCVRCHRAGQIAPFALTSYDDAAGWADTIAEVVGQRRMPPWYADPRYGDFSNDPRFTDAERTLLADWANAGAPEGETTARATGAAPAGEWNIPGPDLVVQMSEAFTVPAHGVLEYQTFSVDPGFREDRWVRAAEIRPGNRRVVHHCNVFLQPPGGTDAIAQGELGSYSLAATAPGTPPLVLPDGMAKLIPAGWRLLFVVHYTPIGSIQTDRTSIALTFADPKSVRKEVATKLLADLSLCIPPGCADHAVEHCWQVQDDALILSLFPHMHLRGRSFRYEAVYPDGRAEILLDVPRYDFRWQNQYVLSEPKRLPAGALVRCTAHYDNSVTNPVNPDPKATVRAGPQSSDEMFNAYLEWALAEQDLTRSPALSVVIRSRLQAYFVPMVGAAFALALTSLCLARRRRTRRAAANYSSPSNRSAAAVNTSGGTDFPARSRDC